MLLRRTPRPRGLFHGLGICAAEYLENCLAAKISTTLAFGTGRTMRAMVSQVSPMNKPQHKIVSVVGNMANDGRASHFEVVMQLADRINAQAFLLQTPVLTSTVEERIYLQQLTAYFNPADGTGKSWLGHRYEYTRRLIR